MKWLYRLGSLCAVFAVTLSFLIVPASAAETAASSMAYDWNRGGVHMTGVFDLPRSDSKYVANKVSGSLTAGSNYYTSIDEFALDVEQLYSGSVAIYVSYYFNTDATTDGTWTAQSGATYEGYYTNDIGGSGVTAVELDYFTPQSGTNPSKGYRMSAHFAGLPELPISGLGIRRTSSAGQCYFTPNVNVSASVGASRYWYFNVPSARVVGVASSAELDALENMADSIAAQNEILNAMYGDIVSICNSIYQQTGDLVAAQNLTNQYFSQLIPILNGIQTNTGNTATNTANIYSLLASQFQLLISTIESESFDIQEVIKGESEALQDAIDDAADKLITYFNGLYEQKTETGIAHGQANLFIGNLENAEDGYFGSFTEGWSQLPALSFDDGLISGLGSVLALFTAVWQVFEPLHGWFYFSWMLGIVLVVIGRKSRTED